MEVIFHISSSWVKIGFNTENQLPMLPKTALNVMKPAWWWCGGFFLTDNNTTPTKVVLSCFGLLVGLWQIQKTAQNQCAHLHLNQHHEDMFSTKN